MAGPALTSARLSIGFSCVGHATMHVLTALYITVAVGLERLWAMPYDALMGLWIAGSLLIGLGAPLAGWLSDRWSEARMMVAFFVLTGAGSVAAGLADGQAALWLGLCVLGVGGSIYHPVGIAWIVRNADKPGQAMGFMGFFGALGIALAAGIAGGLTEAFSWRAAFILPGAVSIGIGLLLAAAIATGRIVDADRAKTAPAPIGRGEAIRAFVFLTLTMAAGALIFNAMHTGMPKWLEQRTLGLGGGEPLPLATVGLLVTTVYLLAAGSQFVGGWLADRYPARLVYAAGFAVQAPLILLAAAAVDLPLVAVAAVIVFVGTAIVPAENVLLARYTPANRRGLAYGAKFVLAFGIGPIAVKLVAVASTWSGGIATLIGGLSVVALVALIAALLVPRTEPRSPVRVAAVPAE